jgi:para-nitrobenzyl esterase
VQGSEDCLTLNIWAPRFTPAELETAPRLPVMVWIHGGGNTIGTARFYVGGHLASAGRVIVVTVQYRLGPLGWFRHPALRAEARDAVEAAGNFGTLDLIRALEWVQENIAAFGGDPGNVTIFGESAGGTNVFSLLLSPQARGLFHRAIVQSGGLRFAEPGQADFPASEGGDSNGGAEVVLRFWTARTGSREAAQATIAKMPPHELATALRSLPAEELLQLFRPEPTGMIRMPLVFRDGTVLPGEAPVESLRSGRFHPVPLLVGTNRDEAKLFLAVDRDLVTYRLWVLPRVRDQHLYALIAGYLSRLWKARGADEPAQAISQHAGTRVFVYRFDWDEEPRFWGTDLAFLLGAAHGLEIPFVFGHFDLGRLGNRLFTHENLEGRIALSEAMLSYWAAFAAAGNPGRGLTGHLPDWLPWDPAAPRFLVLDTPAGGGIRMESGMETRAAILDQLANDPRVRSARERCIVYRYLVETRNLSQREYESLEVCRDFPLSAYPWH